jgi:hypothetical protein
MFPAVISTATATTKPSDVSPDDRLEQRALAAYFRISDQFAPAPTADVVEHAGLVYVVLSNINGLLAVYRVRNDGPLRRLRRWPKALCGPKA